MKVIILAGGGGTRLFPLSRTSFPKQFLKLSDGENSLLAGTVNRFLNKVTPSDVIVVTNSSLLYHVKNDLKQIGACETNVLLEPVARNTAPAIALAASYCRSELKCKDNEIIFVAPADHIIKDCNAFIEVLEQSVQLADKGFIATFGIKPEKPETGFGYIQAGEKLEIGYKVKAFKEKPDAGTAERYVESGEYYWNSGMFAFTLETLQQELEKYAKDISDLMVRPYSEVLKYFDKMPDISMDYAVAEKSDKMAIIPFESDWNDVGSWDAIYELTDKDRDGNAILGDCIAVDCKSSFLLSKDRMIAAVDLEDILIIETDDVILAAKKGHSQKVKNIVDTLKAKGRKEAKEHLTIHKPWGHYTILGEGSDYKLKRLIVNPQATLSLQLHYHRSEHWVVIEGTARVTIGERIQMLHTGESIFIPMSTPHRLENPGKIPLKIIEVQNGAYLEEDDIVRFEDSYGRCRQEESPTS